MYGFETDDHIDSVLF